MQENDKPVLIYTVFPDALTAEMVAEQLINGSLAACANILPGMTSVYRWQGELCRSSEVVMIVKTRSGLAGEAMAAIASRHPYEVPAQLLIPVIGGAPDYIAWLMTSTNGQD